MENKESRHKPMFADVLVSPPTIQSEENPGKSRNPQYMKLVYPNGVTLILPGVISPEQLVEYIKAYRKLDGMCFPKLNLDKDKNELQWQIRNE